MLKVFLVDDEVVVREAIRNNIDWEKTQYSFSGEAADGEMALAILQEVKPDILITDIKMPFLNGLELSRIIRRTMPWVRIVILSGYDEFDFAKEAITIGVQEYLLKPIDSKQLLAVLDKIAAQIEHERQQHMNIQLLEEQASSTATLRRSALINDLLLANSDITELIERARELDVDLIARRYIVVETEFSVNDETYRELLSVRVMIGSLFDNRPDVIPHFISNDRAVFLIKGDHDEQVKEAAYELAQAVKYDIERNTRCTVTVGIGQVVSRLGAVAHSYVEADQARKHLVMLGLPRISGISDMEEQRFWHMAEGAPLSDKLRYAMAHEIPSLLAQYTKGLDMGSSQSMLMCYYILLDILLSCARLIKTLGGSAEDVLPEMHSPELYVRKATTQNKFDEMAIDILKRAIAYRDSCQDDRYGQMINKARQYIQQNYAAPDISLHTVARHVSLSPNHFSTIFSQETGETFIEFLTKVRMEHAKQMLRDTTMRSHEISYTIGYNEPHYFSYIFKKNVGVSPREYRAQMNE